MKKTLSVASLVAIIAACLGMVYRNFNLGDDDGYRAAKQKEVIKQFDRDGDGKLNDHEKKAADEAAEARKRVAYIKKYDKNGDGVLSVEEKQAADKATAARTKAFMKKFDRDGDGKLSAEEKQAATRWAKL